MQIAYLTHYLRLHFAMALLSLTAASTAVAESLEPLVARVQMQLKLKDEIIDVIEKGDLLTVVKENEETYSIVTFNGHRGAVSKVNALKLAEAVEIYSDLIKSDPKEGRRYILRASAWWARGDEKRALADYDMAIQLGYQEPHAYSSRGLFHAALGQYESAVKDYTTAIEKGPTTSRRLLIEQPFI
jgi:tetratricopeptide (TPR) repeat protein